MTEPELQTQTEQTRESRQDFEELGERTVRERIIWAPYTHKGKWNTLKIQMAQLWLKEREDLREDERLKVEVERHRSDIRSRGFSNWVTGISAVAAVVAAIAACGAAIVMKSAHDDDRLGRQALLVASVARVNNTASVRLENAGKEPASSVRVCVLRFDKPMEWGPDKVDFPLANEIPGGAALGLRAMKVPKGKGVYVVVLTKYRSGSSPHVLTRPPTVLWVTGSDEPALLADERDSVLNHEKVRSLVADFMSDAGT